MAKQKRFLKAILDESAKPQPAMPWQRGSRRAAMKSRRIAAELAQKSNKTAQG